jgi:hypothetical protein
MAIFKRRINTSLLPNDILSYTDTQFYDVVKQIVGDNAANLLEFLGIRSAHSLLLIPDVFAILDINCAALKPLKEKLCLISDDDTYIVKPGIKSLMNYFCDLIIKKHDEELKPSSKRKAMSNSLIPTITTTAPTTNTIRLHHQQQSSSVTPTSTVIAPRTSLLDENYHRKFIINSVNSWCKKYSSSLSLVEGVNYHLTLTVSNTNETARIKCSCGGKVSLVKIRKNFQMSNFYKHLVSASCSTINKKKTVNVLGDKDKDKNSLSDNSNSVPHNGISSSTLSSTKDVSQLNSVKGGRKRPISSDPNKTKRTRQSHRK